MIPQPLHPAVVHFPIVLVMLLPLVAASVLVLIRRGADPRRSWLPVVALSLALSVSAWVAVETGEHEEEVVEEVVAESAIHPHEEAAELFLAATVVVLLLVAAGLLGGRPGAIARPVATGAAILMIGLAYRVGHTGGELVYDYGAANAYVVDSGRVWRQSDGPRGGVPSNEEDDVRRRSERRD